MNKVDSARAWLLSRVGNPYLMGGTGQFCTVAYRKARAAQYPGSAAKIKANCPRMRGAANHCKGCRYYDETAGTGKRAYDCAQLTRWCMDAIGIKLVCMKRRRKGKRTRRAAMRRRPLQSAAKSWKRCAKRWRPPARGLTDG